MAKEILEIGNIIGLETLSDYKLFAEREKATKRNNTCGT